MAADPALLDPGSLEVRLVPMRRRHLRGVLRIEQIVYPRPWTIGLFMSELALRTSRVYLVARIGPTVVGYAGLLFSGTDGHVTTLAVDPEWQRQKIGTRLLLEVARRAVRRGATALTLEVRIGNEAAQALYRGFGFAPAGVRRGYYAETGEDALVMWVHDVDAPEYAARLDAIARGVPGLTIVDEQ